MSEYHDLRDLCFWSLRGFWQAWSCIKSWCIPNYQLSVFSKTHHFFIAWFSKDSRKKVLNLKFYGQLPEQAWSKNLFDFFQNRAPQGIWFFSNDFKVKESVYQDGLTTNNDHQSFQNPHYSKFGNIFIFSLLFKIKHHPTSRKKQNEKLFFFVFFFFRNWKHIFCFDKSQIF